jgi:hypothetical protein
MLQIRRLTILCTNFVMHGTIAAVRGDCFAGPTGRENKGKSHARKRATIQRKNKRDRTNGQTLANRSDAVAIAEEFRREIRNGLKRNREGDSK